MGGFQNRPPRRICNFCRPELHEKKFLDSLRKGRGRKSGRGRRRERVAAKDRTASARSPAVGAWARGQVR